MPQLEMRADAAPWLAYWEEDEFWSGSRLWEINNRFFYERLKEIPRLDLSGAILDIGCGAGHLAARLAPAAASVTAVDISERFVAMTRRRCQAWPNVFVQKLGENYTNVSGFGKFSLILCHSVVQYYRNPAEILDLIRSASLAANPGAKILIADLPLKRSGPGRLWDFICSVLFAFRGGYAKELFRTALRLMKEPRYKLFSKERPSLEFSRDEISTLARQCGFKTTMIRNSLSIYANRPSLLIEL